ncbi:MULTISPECIES: hypothetical protein [Delftia]|nr:MULTISPECIES: hypothetical protein [Delftia]
MSEKSGMAVSKMTLAAVVSPRAAAMAKALASKAPPMQKPRVLI